MTKRCTDDPLPPELAALLAAEREAPEPPDGAEARVLARVAAAVGLPAAPAPPSPPPASPLASAPLGTATSAASTGAASLSLPLLLGSGVVVLGAAAVTASLWWSAPQEPAASGSRARSAPVRAPADELARAQGAPRRGPGAASAGPVDVGGARHPGGEGRAEAGTLEAPIGEHGAVLEPVEEPWVFDAAELPAAEPRRGARKAPVDTLAAERALLDEARQKLAAGDDAGALVELNRHRLRFASGKLVEEREALVVIALARGGRLAEARARARRFEARFPQSLHSAAVRAAIADR